MADQTESQQQKLVADEVLKNRLLIEAASEGILAHEGGVILAVNRALVEIVRADGEDELIGSNSFNLIAEEEHPRVMEYVTTGYDKPYETIAVRLDGSRFPALLTVRQISLEGHSIRTITVRDLTEQKEVEDTIRAQSQALMEMSTPAIRIWDGMLLMPLVGAIDTARSQQISTTMLEAIANSDTRVAILDVTGVPNIDTSVARYILQAVSGAKILGAEVIVSGFSPEAAQTLAQLGVDFSTLRTSGSLKAAMQRAFEMIQSSM